MLTSLVILTLVIVFFVWRVLLYKRLDIIVGDFDSLKKYFIEELKISNADLFELKKAIEDDHKLLQIEKLGQNVSAWIDNTVIKPATGLNKLSKRKASSLLAQAIAKYYGF